MSGRDHSTSFFMKENVFSPTETTVDHFNNNPNNAVACQSFQLTFRSIFDLRVTIKRWFNAKLGKIEPLILYYIQDCGYGKENDLKLQNKLCLLSDTLWGK